MVVSISSSQGMPVDARQVVFGHLHNKSLTLSHCGRKCGYRNVVCEKNVVLQENQVISWSKPHSFHKNEF